MTKYQLNIVATYSHNNGFTEKKRETFYSAYVAHLLQKYEKFKQALSNDWSLDISVYKIENIHYMTLDEIGLHMKNDKDYIFICSFTDKGASQF